MDQAAITRFITTAVAGVDAEAPAAGGIRPRRGSVRALGSVVRLIWSIRQRTHATRSRQMSRDRPETGPTFGGEGGIRTHDRVAPITVFETVAFNRARPPL